MQLHTHTHSYTHTYTQIVAHTSTHRPHTHIYTHAHAQLYTHTYAHTGNYSGVLRNVVGLRQNSLTRTE